MLSPIRLILSSIFSPLVSLSATEQSSKTACRAAPSTTRSRTSLLATLLCSCSIASLSAKDVLGVGSGLVVCDGAAGHAAAGGDVVVGLSSLVRVLGDSIAVGGVDDHDHAGLAMLGLRAVDVHGLSVGDGDHEHGRVAGLAVVVLVLSACGGGVGAAVGVAGDGLEVGEDGVLLGLARVVGG